MAVDARSILNHQANDADHRTFAQAIHDMLIAIGLTQTADTGQANLATITRPGSGSASGYEIFRFDDTEQATLGVFVKVEYGSGGANTIPALQITMGTGTNGAGTLTNATSATGFGSWQSSADAAAQTRPAFASYAEGQLAILFGQDLTTANRGTFTYIGRPRAYDGTRTTDGVFLFRKGQNTNGSSRISQMIRAGGSGPALVTGVELQIAANLSGQDDQVGANVAMYPIPVAVNGAIRWTSLFAYRSAAIAADAQQSVTVFGGARNYRTLGNVYTITDVAFAVPYF